MEWNQSIDAIDGLSKKSEEQRQPMDIQEDTAAAAQSSSASSWSPAVWENMCLLSRGLSDGLSISNSNCDNC